MPSKQQIDKGGEQASDQNRREWSFFKPLPYLDEYQSSMLKMYKYKGGDLGFFYINFYNPVALKLVQYLPRNIAPNCITLLGFFFSSFPFFFLFGFYGQDFYDDPKNPIPSWFYFMEAFCYLIYRMLDEMDGKQARRTGNSSALGLLFDHGCDAFTMGFQVLMLSKLFNSGNTIHTILLNVSMQSSFHFSTLEEYYTVMLIGSCIYMGFYGNQQLAQPILYTGTPNEIPLSFLIQYVFILGQVSTCLACLKSAFDHHSRPLAPGEVTGEPLYVWELIGQIFGFYFPMFYVLSLLYMGSDPLISSMTSLDVAQPIMQPFFLIVFLQCLIMSHLTISMQVNHVTKSKYSPYTSRLTLCLLATIFSIQIYHQFVSELDRQTITSLIILMFTTYLVCQLHHVFSIVYEIARALDIKVLAVKRLYPEDVKPATPSASKLKAN